jgi:1-aminocyclopropane-1-carboxylate deaminase
MIELHSPLHVLEAPCMGVPNLWIKRDDLIHPIVSGNKWRKLKKNIGYARAKGLQGILTFGGAYSNHMLATACAGASFGFKTKAYIRGDEDMDNHYLRTARLFGMELLPVSRNAYRDTAALSAAFSISHPDWLVLPEGGASEAAEKGVSEIIPELPDDFTHIICASATATTLCGLGTGIRRVGATAKILGIAILKNAEEQRQKLDAARLSDVCDIIEGYEHGGYAKTTPELMDFCRAFIAETGILLDPVYTAKALFALKDLYHSGYFPPDSKILFLHTGGTLGIFSEKFL